MEIGGTELGSVTLVDGVATLTTSSLPTGTPDVVAEYQPDTNFDTSDGSLNQTVDPAALTIAANNTSMSYGTSNLSDSYTVDGVDRHRFDKFGRVHDKRLDERFGALPAGSWTITPDDAFGFGPIQLHHHVR